ncbi:hypothetical protein [Nocardioides korecus]
MEAAQTVVLPERLLGPSLTAAGLAAWILSFAGQEVSSRRTRDLQDLVDAGLRSGEHDVEIVRTVVEEAVALWLAAADLADAWAVETRTADEDGASTRVAEFGRMSSRLRVRAESLQKVLDRAGRPQL